MEFGPNSGRKFHATPNAGIRVRIPEFLIPLPILYIQTRRKESPKQGLQLLFRVYLKNMIVDTPDLILNAAKGGEPY
jgi:hypothetical protein